MSCKKQQEYIVALVAREARLTTIVVELLKQNGELLEVERESRAEMDTLRKKIDQALKTLEDARLKLVDMEGLQGKLTSSM